MSERRAEPPELPGQPDIRPEPEDLQLAHGKPVHRGPAGPAAGARDERQGAAQGGPRHQLHQHRRLRQSGEPPELGNYPSMTN